MAITTLNSFNMAWGENGGRFDWQPAQYRQGWATIGDVPPSVEQFNALHYLQDEKANFLYRQLADVVAAAGNQYTETAAASLLLDSIQKIIRDSAASDKQAGVVKLVNTLNSTATDAALSAAQGKALNDSKLGNSGSQTINGTLTVQAANAQYAGIHINNTDAGALGSFLGLDVGGLMRGGIEVFGEGEGSYSVALTATAKGDGSDRHERVLSAGIGYVWTRAYGVLHDYFARKTDLTNQINNLRNEINSKFTHTNYPNHYAGAEVWRLPHGLKITTMRIDGINASGDYYLPEAYQGRALAIANDVGDGRRIVSSYLHPNSNRVTVFVNNLNVSANIIAIGWANH